MTEETIDSGGSSAIKNVEAAGFSEELKKQLESRIADSAFRSQNQKAFAEAELPVHIHVYIPPFLVQFLTMDSLRQVKARETKRQPSHGRVPNPFTILLYGCWMTVTNVCEASALLAFHSRVIYVLHQRSLPQLENALPTLETEPRSMQPLCPTR